MPDSSRTVHAVLSNNCSTLHWSDKTYTVHTVSTKATHSWTWLERSLTSLKQRLKHHQSSPDNYYTRQHVYTRKKHKINKKKNSKKSKKQNQKKKRKIIPKKKTSKKSNKIKNIKKTKPRTPKARSTLQASCLFFPLPCAFDSLQWLASFCRPPSFSALWLVFQVSVPTSRLSE